MSSTITTIVGDYPNPPPPCSFDFDVNPQRRRDEPEFYGYIPDGASSRTLLFGCMIVNSALLLLARSGSTALLALVSWRYVAAYYAGDHIIYLAQKAARGDWWFWAPIEGTAGAVLSPINRIIVKAINDFTGVVQFRGSGELGGESARRKG